MEKNEVTKFEFILTLGKNIICQRYFNVVDFNPEIKKSLDLYYVITEICDDIANDLKDKTSEFIYENESYITSFENKNDVEEVKNEMFKIDIKQGRHIFISRILPADVYHPNVRYSVDIRPKLKTYLTNLIEVLSSPAEVKEYL